MSPIDGQNEIVEFLSRPDAYSHRPERVDHLQTPLSHVFVAPPFAYKLKKAVTLSFVDFGTEARRHATCEDEVRLNRRLCRPIYLGVVAVTRDAQGQLALGGSGEALEHLVWMRALPEEGMFARALEEGRIDAARMRRFGGDLAAFHAAAASRGPRVLDADPEKLLARWADVLENCRPSVGSLFSATDVRILSEFGPTFLSSHHDVFRSRIAGERIRECHGDLHAANLCLVEQSLPALPDAGAPRVEPGLYAFDCIEFSDTLRWNDVASEVAFLVMDLEVRQRPDLAEAFLRGYEVASGDFDVDRLLPYYVVHRACVRAMVHAQTARDEEAPPERRSTAGRHAAEFLAYATTRAWRSTAPALLVCTGLSGSGKTALASRLAARTGFRHLSSDEIRKRDAGLDPLAPTPAERIESLYGPDARRRVYEDLATAATETLRTGKGFIADATFTRRADREGIADVARDLGVPHLFLECTAPEAVVRRRLESRARQDVPTAHGARSDADWDVYRKQLAGREALGADEPGVSIDTSARPLEELVDDALALAWRRISPRPPRAGTPGPARPSRPTRGVGR